MTVPKISLCLLDVRLFNALFSTRLASTYTNTFYCKKFSKATKVVFFSDVDWKDWVKKKKGLAFLHFLIKSSPSASGI